MLDPNAIVLSAANGLSVRDIATLHRLTESEVRVVLVEEAARCFGGEELRQEMMLEAKRL